MASTYPLPIGNLLGLNGAIIILVKDNVSLVLTRY